MRDQPSLPAPEKPVRRSGKLSAQREKKEKNTAKLPRTAFQDAPEIDDRLGHGARGCTVVHVIAERRHRRESCQHAVHVTYVSASVDEASDPHRIQRDAKTPSAPVKKSEQKLSFFHSSEDKVAGTDSSRIGS